MAEESTQHRSPARGGGTSSVGKHSRSQRVPGLITLAEVLDNTPAETWYGIVHRLPVSVRVGTLAIDKPFILWINDGLMVFFFLLIALAIPRRKIQRCVCGLGPVHRLARHAGLPACGPETFTGLFLPGGQTT